MLIAAVIVICIVLLVLAFVAPRLSIWPQRGVRFEAFGESASTPWRSGVR